MSTKPSRIGKVGRPPKSGRLVAVVEAPPSSKSSNDAKKPVPWSKFDHLFKRLSVTPTIATLLVHWIHAENPVQNDDGFCVLPLNFNISTNALFQAIINLQSPPHSKCLQGSNCPIFSLIARLPPIENRKNTAFPSYSQTNTPLFELLTERPLTRSLHSPPASISLIPHPLKSNLHQIILANTDCNELLPLHPDSMAVLTHAFSPVATQLHHHLLSTPSVTFSIEQLTNIMSFPVLSPVPFTSPPPPPITPSSTSKRPLPKSRSRPSKSLSKKNLIDVTESNKLVIVPQKKTRAFRSRAAGAKNPMLEIDVEETNDVYLSGDISLKSEVDEDTKLLEISDKATPQHLPPALSPLLPTLRVMIDMSPYKIDSFNVDSHPAAYLEFAESNNFSSFFPNDNAALADELEAFFRSKEAEEAFNEIFCSVDNEEFVSSTNFIEEGTEESIAVSIATAINSLRSNINVREDCELMSSLDIVYGAINLSPQQIKFAKRCAGVSSFPRSSKFTSKNPSPLQQQSSICHIVFSNFDPNRLSRVAKTKPELAVPALPPLRSARPPPPPPPQQQQALPSSLSPESNDSTLNAIPKTFSTSHYSNGGTEDLNTQFSPFQLAPLVDIEAAGTAYVLAGFLPRDIEEEITMVCNRLQQVIEYNRSLRQRFIPLAIADLFSVPPLWFSATRWSNDSSRCISWHFRRYRIARSNHFDSCAGSLDTWLDIGFSKGCVRSTLGDTAVSCMPLPFDDDETREDNNTSPSNPEDTNNIDGGKHNCELGDNGKLSIKNSISYPKTKLTLPPTTSNSLALRASWLHMVLASHPVGDPASDPHSSSAPMLSVCARANSVRITLRLRLRTILEGLSMGTNDFSVIDFRRTLNNAVSMDPALARIACLKRRSSSRPLYDPSSRLPLWPGFCVDEEAVMSTGSNLHIVCSGCFGSSVHPLNLVSKCVRCQCYAHRVCAGLPMKAQEEIIQPQFTCRRCLHETAQGIGNNFSSPSFLKKSLPLEIGGGWILRASDAVPLSLTRSSSSFCAFPLNQNGGLLLSTSSSNSNDNNNHNHSSHTNSQCNNTSNSNNSNSNYNSNNNIKKQIFNKLSNSDNNSLGSLYNIAKNFSYEEFNIRSATFSTLLTSEQTLFDCGSACCVICGLSGGLFKRSTCKQWVHLLCCLMLSPEITPLEPLKLESWSLMSAAPWRAFRPCGVCGMGGGIGRGRLVVSCAAEGCGFTCHPMCAVIRGLKLRTRVCSQNVTSSQGAAWSGDIFAPSFKLEFLCPYHSPDRLAITSVLQASIRQISLGGRDYLPSRVCSVYEDDGDEPFSLFPLGTSLLPPVSNIGDATLKFWASKRGGVMTRNLVSHGGSSSFPYNRHIMILRAVLGSHVDDNCKFALCQEEDEEETANDQEIKPELSQSGAPHHHENTTLFVSDIKKEEELTTAPHSSSTKLSSVKSKEKVIHDSLPSQLLSHPKKSNQDRKSRQSHSPSTRSSLLACEPSPPVALSGGLPYLLPPSPPCVDSPAAPEPLDKDSICANGCTTPIHQIFSSLSLHDEALERRRTSNDTNETVKYLLQLEVKENIFSPILNRAPRISLPTLLSATPESFCAVCLGHHPQFTCSICKKYSFHSECLLKSERCSDNANFSCPSCTSGDIKMSFCELCPVNHGFTRTYPVLLPDYLPSSPPVSPSLSAHPLCAALLSSPGGFAQPSLSPLHLLSSPLSLAPLGSSASSSLSSLRSPCFFCGVNSGALLPCQALATAPFYCDQFAFLPQESCIPCGRTFHSLCARVAGSRVLLTSPISPPFMSLLPALCCPEHDPHPEPPIPPPSAYSGEHLMAFPVMFSPSLPPYPAYPTPLIGLVGLTDATPDFLAARPRLRPLHELRELLSFVIDVPTESSISISTLAQNYFPPRHALLAASNITTSNVHLRRSTRAAALHAMQTNLMSQANSQLSSSFRPPADDSSSIANRPPAISSRAVRSAQRKSILATHEQPQVEDTELSQKNSHTHPSSQPPPPPPPPRRVRAPPPPLPLPPTTNFNSSSSSFSGVRRSSAGSMLPEGYPHSIARPINAVLSAPPSQVYIHAGSVPNNMQHHMHALSYHPQFMSCHHHHHLAAAAAAAAMAQFQSNHTKMEFSNTVSNNYLLPASSTAHVASASMGSGGGYPAVGRVSEGSHATSSHMRIVGGANYPIIPATKRRGRPPISGSFDEALDETTIADKDAKRSKLI